MTPTEIEREFAALQPWITKFVIEGRAYGGQFDALQDGRLTQFRQCFPSAQEILELGSLEGGHTIGLARQAGVRRVVGIEARQENLARATLAKKLLGANNIEFVQANLEATDLASYGKFDALFCSGLLYHLPEPWLLVQQFPRVSQNLFLWTHYAADPTADTLVNGYRGIWYQEGGIADPLSGVSATSFWPTLGSLLAMLQENGYRSVHILDNQTQHPHGPGVTLAASM
ncbi:MAG TPA: class I SAM-dependent methyltransferase [Blastocatellia bacterium]|nr:class I SAM-dependent methyltransferase [Blastocatellia bacterium]HMV83193.1 class I SAM-dependent methyltransferase [Blastocatellia bacterium]HMX27567.1 class I SAM-dependent methyltransferase [Blastocatellia bacterium]HMY72473.1 class I SAM-dependent methyltransferase [Blastocatellia bacterium]HMZ22823.1 class I SAM-dependent methyltransferase [Blastocatellia bacterium]